MCHSLLSFARSVCVCGEGFDVVFRGVVSCILSSSFEPGALWGASDIQKMADRQTIGGLTITMKKEPSSLKVTE